MLKDNHGRTINYLRLAVTDRCNLRCFYCMPEHGIRWLERKELMSYEEMLHLCRILVKMGITKIRITGGEPFARKDILSFLQSLSLLDGLEQLTITTNGVLTASYVPELKRMGIRSVNLSLDTLDRNRFYRITRRDELNAVLDTLDRLLHYGVKVRLNTVVMDGKNTEDILPIAALTRSLPVDVRFIEEMPFNGNGAHYTTLTWDHVRIMDTLRQQYPDIQKIADPPHSTSANHHIPGHKGNIGIIAAYTRSFCGSCNRIRITPGGMMKTCLYDEGVLNLKDLLRGGGTEQGIQSAIQSAIGSKAGNGWQAEQSRVIRRVHESMSTIGG